MAQILINSVKSNAIKKVFNDFIGSAHTPTLNGEEYMIYEPKTISTDKSKTISTDKPKIINNSFTTINNFHSETVVNEIECGFNDISANIGIQIAISTITKILNDIFNENEDTESNAEFFVHLYNIVLSIKEDLKFTKIVGIVNIILFVISAAFYIIRMYTPSSTVSIISGGVLLLFMFTSYVFMISSFEGLSNLRKNTYNEDYKKDSNYKTFILYCNHFFNIK